MRRYYKMRQNAKYSNIRDIPEKSWSLHPPITTSNLYKPVLPKMNGMDVERECSFDNQLLSGVFLLLNHK